ncbi:MAG: hypothetical protein K0S68_401 [Candidatus Saccharibacteria bacterium]|jgi:hypothetical protein|nr:hypothetical protein [Candidatus Saccharibacteria bacterium]
MRTKTVAQGLRKLIYPWRPWRTVRCTTLEKPQRVNPERKNPPVALKLVGWAAILNDHHELDYYILVAKSRTGMLRFALVDSRDKDKVPPWKPVWGSFSGRAGYLHARWLLRLQRIPKHSERQPKSFHLAA